MRARSGRVFLKCVGGYSFGAGQGVQDPSSALGFLIEPGSSQLCTRDGLAVKVSLSVRWIDCLTVQAV